MNSILTYEILKGSPNTDIMDFSIFRDYNICRLNKESVGGFIHGHNGL